MAPKDIDASPVRGKGVQSPTALREAQDRISEMKHEALKPGVRKPAILSVLLSPEEWDKLNRLATQRGICMGDCIRRFIRSARVVEEDTGKHWTEGVNRRKDPTGG